MGRIRCRSRRARWPFREPLRSADAARRVPAAPNRSPPRRFRGIQDGTRSTARLRTISACWPELRGDRNKWQPRAIATRWRQSWGAVANAGAQSRARSRLAVNLAGVPPSAVRRPLTDQDPPPPHCSLDPPVRGSFYAGGDLKDAIRGASLAVDAASAPNNPATDHRLGFFEIP